MTEPRASFPAFAIVFAVVYAIAYLVSVESNHALFTYHPAIKEFGLGVQKAKDGPAMYWFGWMATSGIVAFGAGAVAAFLPGPVTRRLWPGLTWVVALAAMGAFCWLLKGFFLR
jgi:hypothetical protein